MGKRIELPYAGSKPVALPLCYPTISNVQGYIVSLRAPGFHRRKLSGIKIHGVASHVDMSWKLCLQFIHTCCEVSSSGVKLTRLLPHIKGYRARICTLHVLSDTELVENRVTGRRLPIPPSITYTLYHKVDVLSTYD